MKTSSVVYGLLLLLLAPHALCGESDSAQVQVSLVIEKQLRLSNIDNIAMQWDDARNTHYGEDRLCTRLRGYEQYSLTVSSLNGGGNGYLLTQGASRVSYGVSWNHRALRDGKRTLHSANEARPGCGEQGNTLLEIEATQEQAQQASQLGMHSDVLTIMVSAE